jgi:lysozyme
MLFETDFFTALRRMKARRPVDTSPNVSELPGVTAPPQPACLPPADPRTIGPAGLALIKRFEGCARAQGDGRFEAYPDPGSSLSRTGSGRGDPWTIGWGATGRGVRRGTVWTQQQCDERLAADLMRFAREVVRALDKAPTSQAQFDALVSFHYNTGAIARATLTRLHKAGQFDQAAAQFGKWVHAGGKRLAGLVRRREAEAALYRNG